MIYQQHNPFDFNFEITLFSDKSYAIVGKALSLATEFECNVKGIANLFKMIEFNSLENKEQFTIFCSKLENYQYLNNNIKQLAITEPIEQLLNEAKDSRNYIAHDLTKGLINLAESEEYRDEMINELKTHIINIAEAQKILLTIECVMNKEPLPGLKYWNSYPKRIVDWVLGEEI